MYNALGIEGHRAVLVAGIYNCIGPLANLIFIFFMRRYLTNMWGSTIR